ncbi:MAG: hypothetical protein P0S95_03220 [Rhabdochlamydiaceae bacterium]|nr:hypothetical protein [Candidatus Amphrikana amoebophyrae]
MQKIADEAKRSVTLDSALKSDCNFSIDSIAIALDSGKIFKIIDQAFIFFPLSF